MHEKLIRLFKAEAHGLTGSGVTYVEFLLEHLLVQTMQTKHSPNVVEAALSAAADTAEKAKAEREKKLNDS